MQDLIPIVAITFSVGLPLTIPIIWLVLNYRKRRRLMELHHAERMAAIERGMDVPPLPIELIDGRSRRRRRTSLLPGLIWFLVGLALIIGVQAIDEHIPILAGLVPLAVGLAYLIYYFTEGRKLEMEDWQRESSERNNGKSIGASNLT
jgi:uncharacterized protein DUF6249